MTHTRVMLTICVVRNMKKTKQKNRDLAGPNATPSGKKENFLDSVLNHFANFNDISLSSRQI